jgi:hypothetical protein
VPRPPQKERKAAATAMALESATNAADLFRSAIASPRTRARRRSSTARGSAAASSEERSVGGTYNVSGFAALAPRVPLMEALPAAWSHTPACVTARC